MGYRPVPCVPMHFVRIDFLVAAPYLEMFPLRER
jgi:hypothetical protein